MALSLSQLRALAASVGFPNPSLAAAVAMAESSGAPGAVGDDGSSFGLWQVHAPDHPSYDAAQLLEPGYNARAALAISLGGADWRPWSTYRHGDYLRFYGPISPAQATRALAGLAALAGSLLLAANVSRERRASRLGAPRRNSPRR